LGKASVAGYLLKPENTGLRESELLQIGSYRKIIMKRTATTNAKGYGFIVNDAGEDVFVHYRSIEGDGYKTLAEGQQVEYIQTKSDKGWQAAEVTRLEEQPG